MVDEVEVDGLLVVLVELPTVGADGGRSAPIGCGKNEDVAVENEVADWDVVPPVVLVMSTREPLGTTRSGTARQCPHARPP